MEFRPFMVTVRSLGLQLGKVGLNSGSWETPGQTFSFGVPRRLEMYFKREQKADGRFPQSDIPEDPIGARSWCNQHERGGEERFEGVPEELINLRITGEQRCLGDQLREDRSNTPHIHSSRVVARAEKDFGSSIPQCDNLCSRNNLRCLLVQGRRATQKLTSWVYVRSGIPNALARPKSASFKFPSLSISKF